MEDQSKVENELPKAIQDCVYKIIANQSYITYNIEAKNICTGGNNFLGELYEVSINGETDERDKKLHIFVKFIIKNDNFTIYSIPEVYKKEVYFYLELSKIFKKLQTEAKVPIREQLNVAKCYEETSSECILLENLSKTGHKIMPRMEIMSLGFARSGVEQLAKFHALSFVLQQKDPKYYEEKIKTMKQSFNYEEPWYNLIKKVYNISVSQFDGSTRHRLDKFYELSAEKYPKYMNGATSALNCLCHGDYKMNNIMYKEYNGRITSLVPLDFQQIYFGCPVIDLIYFIYAATDRCFRTKHMNALKDHYYYVLTAFLKYFDVIFEWSKAEFDQLFESSLDYALMFTLYMLPMFYVVDEQPSGRDDLMELFLNVDDRFHARMKEIVDEFKDMNII